MERIRDKRNNIPIREAMKAKGYTQWQTAELLGISEFTLSRWMRHELPEQRQMEIVELINNGGNR